MFEGQMPLATSTSTLPRIFMASLSQRGEDNSNVSLCLGHLYIPHGRYSRFFGRKLRCFGKGVMLRGETSSLSNPDFGFDLSDFSSSWKGHNKLSQKGDSWSSSYCRSDEDVNSAFHFTDNFRWLTFSFIKKMEDMGWVPQRSTIVVTQCMSHWLTNSSCSCIFMVTLFTYDRSRDFASPAS